MKREWKAPNLEVLDVRMTMSNTTGDNPDGSWTDHVVNIQNNDCGDPGAGVLS